MTQDEIDQDWLDKISEDAYQAELEDKERLVDPNEEHRLTAYELGLSNYR